MQVIKTQKRNIIVVIQTSDLDEIHERIERQLRKFDVNAFEIMPGVWHVATGAPIDGITTKMIGAVSDREDDRVFVLGNPDEFGGWDGHRGQHVRSNELSQRFIRTQTMSNGKTGRYQPKDIPKAEPPEWIKRLNPSKKPSKERAG